MYSEPKSLSIWAIFAIGLMLASLFLYSVRRPPEVPEPPLDSIPPIVSQTPTPVPPLDSATPPTTPPIQDPPPPPVEPRKPVVTVSSITGDLEKNGEVRIHFTLDQPALAAFEIGYTLVSKTVGLDDHFSVEPQPLGTLVIDKEKTEADLVLKKLSTNPATAHASYSHKEGRLTLLLGTDDRFQYVAGSRRGWEFPYAMTEYGPPYQVSLVPARGFQEEDARRQETVSVVFELDRPPTDHPIPIRFRLGGSTLDTDFEVVNRPQNDTLTFPKGERRTQLVLRRRPGPRGLGDRLIRVDCDLPLSGEVAVAQGRSDVSIQVPDPASRLSWKIEEPRAGAKDPRKPATARLIVTIQPPTSERVVFRYRIGYPNRDDLREREQSLELVPPADLWASESTSEKQVLEFPPDDLVYPIKQADDRAMRARLEPIGGFPKSLEPLPDFVVHDAEPETLSGRVMVLLVLTRNLVGADQTAWRELQRFQTTLEVAGNENLRNGLVGRSVLVLEHTGRIYRFRSEARNDRELKPFPEGAKLGAILDKSTKEAAESLFNRMSLKDQTHVKKVLLLYDIADQDAKPVIDALNSWLHGRLNWWVFWNDPNAGRSPLAKDVNTIRQGADLNRFGAPDPGLSEHLLELLRGG